jgi:hypothetical protein
VEVGRNTLWKLKADFEILFGGAEMEVKLQVEECFCSFVVPYSILELIPPPAQTLPAQP